MPERQATVTWEGTLPKGRGTITTASGALKDLPVTWASRTEAPEGKTSPEELLAAAEAECYAMVMTNTLNQAGHTPKQVQVQAVCTVEFQDGGLKITTMRLHVTADVDGLDQQQFQRMAEEGERACPVSNALRGNVHISVRADLKQGTAAP